MNQTYNTDKTSLDINTGEGQEGILEHYYDYEIDSNLQDGITKDKGIITNIDYNNEYLIYKTPKVLKYLKPDGSLLSLSTKYYCTYIEVNKKTGAHKIKQISNYFLLGFNLENGTLDEELTSELLSSKLTYDLAQIEKKHKGKISIDISSLNVSLVKYSLAKYEVSFVTHNDKVVKKIVQASDIAGNTQIKILASYLLKKNAKKFKAVKKIYQIDFSKTFWAKIFFSPERRKKMSLKDLHTFTYKIHKIWKAKTAAGFGTVLDDIIATSNKNVRATAIELKDIMNKNPTLTSPGDVMKKMNQMDIANGNRPNFDEIYLAMVETLGSGVEASRVFENIAEVLDRRVFLQRTLKSAIRNPTIVIIFLLGVMAFTTKSFAPILFEIYDGIGEPRPKITVLNMAVIDFITNNIFFVVFLIYLIYTLYKYFSETSFYGKKVMHNIYITIPLLGDFLKKTDYEIFLSVAQQLYAGSRGHEYVLPILKQTVSNEHIRGVVNTAAYNFSFFKGISPGETFDKFPQYIDTRLANLMKSDSIDTSDGKSNELQQLALTYRYDNDEFIKNMKSMISTGLMMIGAIIITYTMFGSVIPMIELVNKF